jgi:hypothetical protein
MSNYQILRPIPTHVHHSRVSSALSSHHYPPEPHFEKDAAPRQVKHMRVPSWQLNSGANTDYTPHAAAIHSSLVSFAQQPAQPQQTMREFNSVSQILQHIKASKGKKAKKK